MPREMTQIQHRNDTLVQNGRLCFCVAQSAKGLGYVVKFAACLLRLVLWWVNRAPVSRGLCAVSKRHYFDYIMFVDERPYLQGATAKGHAAKVRRLGRQGAVNAGRLRAATVVRGAPGLNPATTLRSRRMTEYPARQTEGQCNAVAPTAFAATATAQNRPNPGVWFPAGARMLIASQATGVAGPTERPNTPFSWDASGKRLRDWLGRGRGRRFFK